MSLMQWDEEFRVNIPDIDEQHERFIAFIGELHELRRKKNSLEEIGTLIDQLLAYARLHFHTEERYFDLFLYDDASLHKREHGQMLKKLQEFKDSYESKADLFLTMKLARFLSEWLEDHLAKIDRKFAGLLLANRLG